MTSDDHLIGGVLSTAVGLMEAIAVHPSYRAWLDANRERLEGHMGLYSAVSTLALDIERHVHATAGWGEYEIRPGEWVEGYGFYETLDLVASAFLTPEGIDNLPALMGSLLPAPPQRQPAADEEDA